jgi:hypothetical protein
MGAIVAYLQRQSDLPRNPSFPFPPSGGKGTPPPSLRREATILSSAKARLLFEDGPRPLFEESW